MHEMGPILGIGVKEAKAADFNAHTPTPDVAVRFPIATLLGRMSLIAGASSHEVLLGAIQHFTV